MAPDKARGRRTTALTWGAIALVCVVGVLVGWLVSDSAVRTAGYGPAASITVLAASGVSTVAGMLVAGGIVRTARLPCVIVLAAVAGAVLPLAVVALTNGDGYGIPLVLAVVGMEWLAVSAVRAGS
jgi:hypothetical protein